MTQATELRELATLLDVSSGNVGIGLPSGTASNKLVISDGVRTSAAITAGTTALEIARTGGGDVGILINKDIAKWLIGIDNSDGNAAPLRFMYGAYNTAAHPGFGSDYAGLNLTYQGRVGVGTKIPQYELHVAGAGDIKIEDTGGGSAHLHIASSTSGLRNSEWRLKTSGQNDEFYIDHRYTANDGSNDVAVSGVDSAFKINSIQSLYNDNRQPTVRPTLNLDFAKSKELDPRITFYRDSIATYYDSKGIIRYANTNEPRFDHDPVTGESKGLLIEEERTNNLLSHFNTLTSDQGLLQFNAAKGLDGTYSAYTLTRNGAASSNVYWRRSGTISFPDNTMLLSMYVKPIGTCDVFMWSFQSINSAIVRFGFELSGNGSASVVTAGNGGHSVSIEAVQDGWYHCKAVVNAQSSGATAQFLYAVTSFSESSGCAVGSGLTFWGGQLESGSFPTSYIPPDTRFISRSSVATYYDETGILRTAPANSPRYGYKYDGRKWVETGLILEKASTNIAKNVNYWGFELSDNQVRTSFTTDTLAPDGSYTATKFDFTSITNNAWGDALWFPGPNYAGTTKTFSVWLKGTSGQTVAIRLDGQGAGGSYKLITLTGDWQREHVTYTYGSAYSVNAAVRIGIRALSTAAGTATVFYAWGTQLEEGSVMSSYIHQPSSSNSASVTRSADVATSVAYTRERDYAIGHNLDKLLPSINEGSSVNMSAYAETSGMGHNGGFQTVGYLEDTSDFANNYIQLFSAYGGNNTIATAYNIGGTAANFGNWTSTASDITLDWKIAIGIEDGSQAAAANGTLGTLRSNTIPSGTFDILYIGNGYAGGRTMNGHIKKLSFYDQKLANAELQALTENN